MSKAFEKVLLGLQEFASSKISILEKLADDHNEWLSGVVAEAEKHVGASARAPEKRKSRMKKDPVPEGKKRQKKGTTKEDESEKEEMSSTDNISKNEGVLEGSKARRGGRRRKMEELKSESEGNHGRSTRSSSRKNQTRQKTELEQPIVALENIVEEEKNIREDDEAGIAVEGESKDSKKQSLQPDSKSKKTSSDTHEKSNEKHEDKVFSAPVEQAEYDQQDRFCTEELGQEDGRSPQIVDRSTESPMVDDMNDYSVVQQYDSPKGNAEGFEEEFEDGPVPGDKEPTLPFQKSLSVVEQGKADNFEKLKCHFEDETLEAPPASRQRAQVVASEVPRDKSLDEKGYSNESNIGFAANLISSVKTLLPSSDHASSKESEMSEQADEEAILLEEQKAKEKLEREEAERKAELEEKARLERIEAEKAREQEQLRKQKEEDIAAKRRARQEEERRKREEKAKRLEEHKRRRKLEAEAAARSGSGAAGLQGASIASGGSLAAAKERLAKIQQQAAMLKNSSSKVLIDHPSMSTQNRSTFSGTPQGVVNAQKSIGEHSGTPKHQTQGTSPNKQGENVDSQYRSYEISPYRSDHASDDDVPKKPVPEWARGKTLMAQLVAQMYVDPDEVFQQHAKTCSLDQVFADNRKHGRRDFSKRNSSGNWIEDRVTWKEELGYKRAMGYI